MANDVQDNASPRGKSLSFVIILVFIYTRSRNSHVGRAEWCNWMMLAVDMDCTDLCCFLVFGFVLFFVVFICLCFVVLCQDLL